MIKEIFYILLGCIFGAFAVIVLVGLTLDKVSENTITFETDSEWFSECKGDGIGEFVLIFGTMDCEDLGLEQLVQEEK